MQLQVNLPQPALQRVNWQRQTMTAKWKWNLLIWFQKESPDINNNTYINFY